MSVRVSARISGLKDQWLREGRGAGGWTGEGEGDGGVRGEGVWGAGSRGGEGRGQGAGVVAPESEGSHVRPGTRQHPVMRH